LESANALPAPMVRIMAKLSTAAANFFFKSVYPFQMPTRLA
jgi:hypothetical protein